MRDEARKIGGELGVERCQRRTEQAMRMQGRCSQISSDRRKGIVRNANICFYLINLPSITVAFLI